MHIFKMFCLVGMLFSFCEAQCCAKYKVSSVSKKLSPFPDGYVALPTMNTGIKLNGKFVADALFDPGVNSGQAIDVTTLPLRGVPSLASKKGQFTGYVKQSNLAIRSFTPTEHGDLEGLIQFDIFGDSSSNAYQFRPMDISAKFSGTWGYLKFGRFKNNFSDQDSLPFMLDWNGANGSDSRLFQIVYGKRSTFMDASIGLSQPNSDYTDTITNASGVNQYDYSTASSKSSTTFPDVSVNVKFFDKDKGHISLRGAFRNLSVRDVNGVPVGFYKKERVKVGAVVGISGKLNIQKDALFIQSNFGWGAGNYIPETKKQAFLYDSRVIDPTKPLPYSASTAGNSYLQKSYNLIFGYERAWTEKFKTRLIYTRAQSFNKKIYKDPATLFVDQNKIMSKYVINNVYSLNKNLDIGFEASRLERRTDSNKKAKGYHYQFSLIYVF